jgi:hypothetical protein
MKTVQMPKQKQPSSSTKFSNLQQELLKLFSYGMPDEEVKDIEKMLADYFTKKVNDEMNRLWKLKRWTQETIEEWQKEDLHISS